MPPKLNSPALENHSFIGWFFTWRVIYLPYSLCMGRKVSLNVYGGVYMLDIRDDKFVVNNGVRFKCHKSHVFITVDDLREPLPESFSGLSAAEKDAMIKSLLYKDSHGYIYCKSESANLVKCEKCGSVYHKSFGLHTEDYGDVCDRCKNDFKKCHHCGKWYYNVSRNGRSWLVSDNGERMRYWICRNCFDGDHWQDSRCAYTMCTHCSDLVLREEADEEGRCPRCHEEMKNRALFSYHYTDRPGYGMEFLGIATRKTNPLLGVELEIDKGGESNSNAKTIRDIIGEGRVVCTTDGSLHNGFEIVSAPANLKHHLETIKWEEGMKKAKELGYVSHDGGRCGLHVHIDREFFGSELKDDVEAKFFIILRNNLSWIRTFSRRYNYGYCQINGYERSEDGFGDSLGAITYPPDKVWLNSKKQSGRHCALNFYPEHTIEIRVFRGTLNYKTFVATLQFVEMWATLVKNTELNNIVRISLAHFISMAERRHYNEFLDYLKERKITDDNATGF